MKSAIIEPREINNVIIAAIHPIIGIALTAIPTALHKAGSTIKIPPKIPNAEANFWTAFAALS